jgi:hypothetical protein
MNAKFSLDNSPKIETGFKVSDDYFNQLHTSLSDKIKENDKQVVGLYQSKKWHLAVAAIVILSISISAYYLLNNQSLHHDDVEEYIHYSSISQEDVYDVLNDQDVETLEKKLEMALHKNEIEHFLGTQNINEYYLID